MSSERARIAIGDLTSLPHFLTEHEAAAVCRVSPQTVRTWVRTDILQRGQHWILRAGRRRLYRRDDLVAWLEGLDDTAITPPRRRPAGRRPKAVVREEGRL